MDGYEYLRVQCTLQVPSVRQYGQLPRCPTPSMALELRPQAHDTERGVMRAMICVERPKRTGENIGVIWRGLASCMWLAAPLAEKTKGARAAPPGSGHDDGSVK